MLYHFHFIITFYLFFFLWLCVSSISEALKPLRSSFLYPCPSFKSITNRDTGPYILSGQTIKDNQTELRQSWGPRVEVVCQLPRHGVPTHLQHVSEAVEWCWWRCEGKKKLTYSLAPEMKKDCTRILNDSNTHPLWETIWTSSSSCIRPTMGTMT